MFYYISSHSHPPYAYDSILSSPARHNVKAYGQVRRGGGRRDGTGLVGVVVLTLSCFIIIHFIRSIRDVNVAASLTPTLLACER